MSKLDEIRDAVARVSNWRITGYGGEHEETGANVYDDTGKYVLTTASHGANDPDWTQYFAIAHVAANAPDYIRYLLDIIDGKVKP